MDNEERRKYPRFDVDFDVSIVATEMNGLVAEILNGKVLNISKDGLCMRTDYAASISSLLFLSIVYGGRDSLFLAEVVWRTQKGTVYTYGLHIQHWTHLDPTMERLVLNRPIPESSRSSDDKQRTLTGSRSI